MPNAASCPYRRFGRCILTAKPMIIADVGANLVFAHNEITGLHRGRTQGIAPTISMQSSDFIADIVVPIDMIMMCVVRR